MAELQIIGGPQSNFVWTTRIVCAGKSVPYQHLSVIPHTPDVDAIHPFGKIPVMRHGDVALCESRAIISYIDRHFDGPSLMPRDPVAAAQVRAMGLDRLHDARSALATPVLRRLCLGRARQSSDRPLDD